ncbi:endonuclease III [Candidatus Giovannonibacteria bacterium]|nr:endonuclease III [Candidatus Giovannonibacteria bacterium]
MAQIKDKASQILKALKKEHPKAQIALNYGNDFQLLAAVVLSAQCTDKKVNEVTEPLFSAIGGSVSGRKKYWSVDDFANADPKVFEKEIKPTGFYRAKAKNIIGAAKMLKEKFGGKIPKKMEEIIRLPGVGRKSANIILGNAYGIVEGIAVDTHVKRFAKMCGLSKHEDPVKIEKDLMALIPKKEWFSATYRIIDHGRDLRFKKKEHAVNCPVCKLCPAFVKA